MSETPTPRTDAAAKHTGMTRYCRQMVQADFARTLERELVESKTACLKGFKRVNEMHRNAMAELERGLASSDSIRRAEKKILIDEIAAHTETKRALAAATAEQGKLNDALGVADICQIEPLVVALRAEVERLKHLKEISSSQIRVIAAEAVQFRAQLAPAKTAVANGGQLLADANATIAELTTDGNAITLAANLARKSVECAQANERAEKAEAALLDAREAKNRFKKVASGLAAENLNETEELHGRINDMQASIASDLRATGAVLALTVCQADFMRDTGKRSEVIAATKDALTTLLAKLEGKT